MNPKPPYLVTSAHMIPVPANWCGLFIRFQKRAKKDMTRGNHPIQGSGSEAPTPGWVWPLIGIGELSMPPRVRQLMTFMAETEKGTTCMPIACWHWMQLQARNYGIFSWSAMIFGT